MPFISQVMVPVGFIITIIAGLGYRISRIQFNNNFETNGIEKWVRRR